MDAETLVIVGTGPAGLTCAVYAARANLRPLLIDGTLPGGQLTQTTEVENYPGFPEGISGFVLMQNMRQQAERFGTRSLSDTVARGELSPGGPHKLFLGGGKTIETQALVIATGARPRWLGVPGEEELKNKGVSACATCDGAFFRDVPIAVVGGGDSAIEEALFLTRFGSKVFVVHRRKELRASKIMQERAFANPKIAFCWDSVVDEILGVDADRVTGVRLRNVETGELSTLDCGAVFMAIGHTPSTEPFRDQVEMDERGYIRLQGQSSRTSIEGVFAAGDCADSAYRQAVTAAGMGCRAAIDAERWLAERE
ncbi:MAG: thioredoxin-disulfide reductase [Kiritimatiellaeota bacterium]|nr:thioredoxin-disulfide reductase [Kiritimatiellota bacterium]